MIKVEGISWLCVGMVWLVWGWSAFNSALLLPYLCFQRERVTVPRSGQPGQTVKFSPHQDPASGGPTADRNLQGLAYGAPAQATCGMSLIRDSRYRRNSINPSALSVRPPPLDANIERWGNVSIPTSPTGRVGTRLRLIVGRLVFIIAL